MLVGSLPEISPSPGSGGGHRGAAGAALNPRPSPGLTLSTELVKTLLNEPSSVKVDEVSPQGQCGGWGKGVQGENEGQK